MARFRMPPDHELPTIGDCRRHWLKALRIHCLAYPCHRTGRKTFDELALPDAMIFVHIARYRRFVCSVCGRRQLEITADWRDHDASGMGRPHKV